jgi:Sulfotransferase family
LSLPRSGSTLVQRVLAAHDEISTTPEPWLLLPQIYAMRERGAFAEYGQTPSSRAIREFAAHLPDGDEDYREELRRFVLRLYSKASGEQATYFLDKTPRYHFVVEELFELFPDARFLFLWRHPLAVAASIAQTWARGTWSLQRWRLDLFDGLANLVEAYERHAGACHAVRYEQLIAEPRTAWPPIFEHLRLPFDPSLLDSFGSVMLGGRMGDHSGARRYSSVSSEPLSKWKDAVSTPLRKRWCRRYLRWIGERRLAIMGYELTELLGELDAIPTRRRLAAPDLIRGAYWRAIALQRDAAVRTLTRPRGRRHIAP